MNTYIHNKLTLDPVFLPGLIPFMNYYSLDCSADFIFLLISFNDTSRTFKSRKYLYKAINHLIKPAQSKPRGQTSKPVNNSYNPLQTELD